jgi:peptide deformylase
MSILPIVTYGHPALRQTAKQVQEVEDLRLLAENMFHTMHNAQGIGLAANQLNILKRIIVIDLSELEDYKDMKPMVIINPEIIRQEGTWTMEEGCLSIPTVRDEVERSEKVRIRYIDLESKEHELVAEGVLGRVILHEIDHLNGVLFLDHLSPGKRKFHKGVLNEIKKGELEIPYPIVTAEQELS